MLLTALFSDYIVINIVILFSQQSKTIQLVFFKMGFHCSASCFAKCLESSPASRNELMNIGSKVCCVPILIKGKERTKILE